MLASVRQVVDDRFYIRDVAVRLEVTDMDVLHIHEIDFPVTNREAVDLIDVGGNFLHFGAAIIVEIPEHDETTGFPLGDIHGDILSNCNYTRIVYPFGEALQGKPSGRRIRSRSCLSVGASLAGS